METKKDIIADAGMELTDDELVMVAGGTATFHPEIIPNKPKK